MDNFIEISRLIDAVRPWLHQLVLVGGWAHRLYRFHPLANQLSYLPLMTKDADLAFQDIEGDIGTALKDAGFEKEFRGDRTPPVTHYHLGSSDKGFYAEFLVPLIGGRTKRDGTLTPITVAQAGVVVQKLRYIDLLLKHPWNISLNRASGFDLVPPADIILPNPVSFIIQKILIHNDRLPSERAQDTLYIHDTLELFAGEIETLNNVWNDRVRPDLPPKTVGRIEKLYREQFEGVTDIHRNAARIPQDRNLRPERIQLICAMGIREILECS